MFKTTARLHRPYWAVLALFFLFHVAAAAQTIIVNGQAVTGSVSGTGSVTYKFYATSGNYFLSANLSTVGAANTQFLPYLQVSYPDGTSIHGTYDDNYGVRVVQNGSLTQTGYYTATVKNYVGSTYPNFVGNYSLIVNVTSTPIYAPSPTGSGLLTTSQTGSGTITRASQDAWQFYANNADNLYVTMSAGGSNVPYLTLIGPNGAELVGNYTTGSTTVHYNGSGGTGLYTVYAYQNGADNTFTYTISMTGSTALNPAVKLLGAGATNKKRKRAKVCYVCADQAETGGDAVASGQGYEAAPINLGQRQYVGDGGGLQDGRPEPACLHPLLHQPAMAEQLAGDRFRSELAQQL